MQKNEINDVLRDVVRARLSPTQEERAFVAGIYAAVRDLLGDGNTLQIGSYPRYTAIRPLHDLDVLYILGRWNPEEHDPTAALVALEGLIRNGFQNPTEFQIEVSRQTHSVTIKFFDRDEEKFAVDIVPAYVAGTNEFREDTYVVPEIAVRSRSSRSRIYADVAARRREMTWLSSDPRGYITTASQLNQQNSDFRKAVKFVKGWRASCKLVDDDFPLKSFHAEVAIADFVRANPQCTIFDAIFDFFVRLQDYLTYPQFPDRADPNRNIDEYVRELSHADRKSALEFRDALMMRLEDATSEGDIAELIEARQYRRASTTEAFLFDQKIPMLTEQNFSIVGNVQPRDGGFRGFILDVVGLIQVDRKIEFRVGRNAPPATLYKWKVRNDATSAQPRGEITDHHTMHDPEHTKYRGRHYVECFAIVDDVCIGRSRQNVELRF